MFFSKKPVIKVTDLPQSSLIKFIDIAGMDKIKEIESRIADLKARWPAHSVPPSMWQQLEELEEELEKAEKEKQEKDAK